MSGLLEEVGEVAHGGQPTPSWEQYYHIETRVRQIEHRLELFSTAERRIEAISGDLAQIKIQVEAHHQHVTEVKQLLEDIKELLQVYENARGTVTILAALGGLLKWVAGVGAACVVLWVWLKTGIKS
ncbi:hypothetical protein [Chitinibacter tainanensis]|uniref:hypothetical protein n=1 Tax=Chitinibacter tainanensis TaxID=230667 RepID=UPI002357C13A|nr:hypothetical protein [Chitinibacter tainanensis]